ncbi:serine/threonine-protein kinase [Phycicoccus avicenniae]|uniref:serine/threonine-protein kinase n=1 Tax=Phycicoccus avicenniae TaxID=2828860 RepID=UPI003D2CFD28
MNRLEQGYLLGERYLLGSRIASGGMGDVWQAEDRTLGRTVAVKVLRPSIEGEPLFARRFRAEALYTAALSHPNIATVYDYGEEGTLAYLVMELVEGEPLSALVRREGAQTTEKVRSVLTQAALALGAAHEAGVVHRDVKPANILVRDDGVVKLTDFGIARALDGSGHTLTGEVLGTPHYLSPEQALGEPATGASDLYALGVVAHEMLTGKRPFDKNTPVATALAQVNDPPPPLPDHVTGSLRSVIEQCLAKRAEDRPASARELGERLGLPDAHPGRAPAALEVVGAALLREQPDESVIAGQRSPAATPVSDEPHTPSAPLTLPRRLRRAERGHARREAATRHVHWAWVPTVGLLTALATALTLGLVR